MAIDGAIAKADRRTGHPADDEPPPAGGGRADGNRAADGNRPPVDRNRSNT